MEERTVLEKLVSARDAIQQKYTELRRNEVDENVKREKDLRPITKPLRTMVERASISNPLIIKPEIPMKQERGEAMEYDAPDEFHSANDESSSDEEEEEKSMTRFKKKMDDTFRLSDTINIGRMQGKISSNYLHLDKKAYKLTNGLNSLINDARPIGYTKRDLNAYKKILLQTKAHLSVKGRPKAVNSYKYINIISKLFNEDTRKIGGGYQYYDDPNELVERLYLLNSSATAGNTGHNNEIIDIIEELRELKIIA